MEIRENGHMRRFTVSGIPERSLDGTDIPLRELDVAFVYAGTGNVEKGVTLDHAVIPQMLRGFPLGELTDRQREVAYAALKYAEVNWDVLNEALGYSLDDPPEVTLRGREVPEFKSHEFAVVASFFHIDEARRESESITKQIDDELTGDEAMFTVETARQLAGLTRATLVELLLRITKTKRGR